MMMPERKYEAQNSYRYGFNGKENDNEVKGEGNEIAFENRIYEPRLGKLFSLDPLQKKYPAESNYTFVSDNPIIYADKEGKDKIYTLTYIDKDGKTTAFRKVVAGPTYYSKAVVSGFGNNRYYEQDVLYNVTVDMRGKNPTVSYSEKLGDKEEIGVLPYGYGLLVNAVNDKIDSRRASQPGGITFTSAFSTEADAQKTDATQGSSGSVNIDALMAAFEAFGESGETLKSLPDLVNLGKDIVELHEESKEETPSNSSSNTKQTPVKRSTPPRDGAGWNNYVRDKNGKFVGSDRIGGLPDSTVKGKNGAPDTIYERPFKKPPAPKKNIINGKSQ